MGNKKKLYDNLIKSGRLTVEDIGDFATFDSITNNPESIGKLYSNLRKDDLFTEEELGDGATFASMLAVDPPVDEVVAPQPMQDQIGSPLVSTPEREFVAPGEVSPAKVEEIKAEKEKEIKNIGAGREAIMGSVTDPVEKEVLGYALDATEKEYVTRGGMTPLQKMAEFSKRMKVIDDSMNEEAISQLDQAGIDALEAEYEKMAKSNAYELGLEVKPDGSVKPFDREMDAYMEKVDFHVRLKAGEKEEAGKAGLGKQMANKLAAGISSFTANTLDTFGFVTGANYFEGYKKLHEGQRYRVDQYRSAANRYDQNIQSYVEQGNIGAAAAVTVGSALESLPSMIPIFLHPTSGLYVMSAGAGMEKFREIEDADIPEWKKYYNSFLTAANEYAGEKLVTIPILKRSREAVLRLGEKSGREAIVNATKSVIRDKAAIPSLPEWVKEGASEVFTTLGNDIADKVTVSPEKKIGATAFDDFVVGSLMGKIFSLPQDISNMRDRESARKFAKEVLEKLPSDMDVETKIELGWLLVERGALEEKENKLADEFKGKYAPRIEEINKKVQSISNKYLGIEVAPPTIKKEAPAAAVSEEQSKVDYLKSRGQVVPDGTDMKTLEEMFSAEKTKERTEVNTEIDTKVKKAQEELGLPDVPNIEISEDTEATLDRLDEGLPVTNEYIESASQELYDRYRELEAMKSSDTRLYTTEQIDDMQGYLGEEIERLENYASEQKETGKFVGEVKGGEVAEGKAEGVAEGVREEVKEEPVQEPEVPVEEVSPKAEQVAPTEEKVAVKVSEAVFEPVEFEKDLYQDKKVSDVGGKKYEFSRLNTKGEENVFLVEENGAEIGRATLSQDGKYIENVRINEDKRRQGLGTRLYDYIEQQTGTKLEPSPVKQTKEAKAFWKKRKEGVKAADEVVVSPSNVKQQQFDVIQQSNPITDDVHTGIRKVEDIKTAEEVFSESISKNEGATPDFTADDMKSALESGEITVYSSKEIADGVFVTPSKMEAKSYAGKGKVYSKKVALADVAWVDNVEGQYAKVKLVKEEKKESDDKKTKRRLQRVDKQPAADGKPIVGKGETSPQGTRLVDGAVVKAGDEVFYNGEKRKVKAVKGDVLTIPGVGDVHKSKVLSSAKIVQDKRPLDLNEKNPDNVNDDLLSDEVFDRIRKQNIEPTDVEVLSTAALAKSLMNGDISADAAIDAAVSRFVNRGTVPDHVPFFKAAPGAKYTSPYATYNDAVRGADNVGKNLWVRNTPFSTNKQRVLLVQFSSNFLYGKQPFKRDKESSYFDKLYRLVAGYNRTVDFWEVPLWIARVAGLQRNADVYVIRDIEEAKKFISEAGYASVHFSALDVNEKHIVDVIQSTPGVKYQIGGYTDFKRIEALPDVTVYKSIDEYVEKNKLIDIDGTYSYRHFKGTAVIPRLKLSEGCLYKCAFCSIPKKVIPVKKEWIDSQIESIKDLDATLVYLDDKTFGQAENYTLLPELYDRIKEYNPDFKGFIVQTTALDFANKKKFGTEYLKNSHIQFVELGVETYNDDILTKLNKRHSHKKFVDAAMENARENNIKVIPNIIVGLSWNEGTKEKPVIKTETRETYQNTLDFLENNKDVISHVNVYSLALYEGTELSDAIEVKEEADKNENIIAKSWQENKEDHVWAMDEFSDFASNQIKEEKKDEVQKEEKGLRNEKVNARFKKIAKQTGTDVETVTKMYDTLMSVFGLSQDKALAAAVIVDRMVDTMAKRRNKTKADIYATIKWEKSTMEEIMKFSPLMQSTLWHGSPYQFDKFTTEKIGTGEGAQAFGWGLYFTELRGIAEYYARTLRPRAMTLNGKEYDENSLKKEFRDNLYLYNLLLDIQNSLISLDGAKSKLKNKVSLINRIKDLENTAKEAEDKLKVVLEEMYSLGLPKQSSSSEMKSFVEGKTPEYFRLEAMLDNVRNNRDYDRIRSDMDKIVSKHRELGRERNRLIRERDVALEFADSTKYVEFRNMYYGTFQTYEDAANLILEADKYVNGVTIGFNKKDAYVYKIIAHKGKTPNEYEWLEWNKQITEDQLSRINTQLLKEGKEILWDEKLFNELKDDKKRDFSGSSVYRTLTIKLGSDKEASLFLLRVGIDGNKYPAESVSGSPTRGYNFVVFDENAITIEEAIKFQQRVLGSARGAQVWQDAYAVIYALTDPNITTPLHELAHVYEKYLTAKEKESVLKWTNEKSWSTNTSESFARGFERFLYDGTAPANLKSIFQKFAAWLRDIYKSITLSEIKLDLNDDMKKIYSAMLGAEYKGEVIKEAAPVAETTAESEADAFFGNLAVDENGVTVLSDEEIADDFFSKLEVDENGYTLLQMIGTVGAARLDAAENNNRRIFNLHEAMKMTDANKTAEEIKLATGWEKGKDKRWRYEIPPTMKIKKAWDKLGVSALDNKQELSITEALDYPELFAAYPELEKIKIRKDKAFLDIFQSVQGWYDSDNMELVVAPHAIDPFGTILHELQHAVQMVEGFATGTNTDSVIEAIPDFEFENVVDQIVEKLERDIKKNIQKNLDRRKILSEMTSQEEADIRRYSKEIIAAKEEGDRIYEEEKAKFPDKNPYKDNKRLLELTEVKTDLRSKINDIIERIIGERSITLAIEFAYGIEAVEEVIEETSNKIIEDNKSVRVIKSGADRKTIIDNFRPSIGDMAYNYYKRVAGEVEARNVAARAKLTPEQRKSTAESTEDIPRDQQIVMRGGKIVSMDMGAMTVTVDGKKRPVLNSEGRPIHNTEEGIINFWKWFGDSKVVDAQGRPLVVFHGTQRAKFTTFDSNLGFNVNAVYHASNRRVAAHWSGTSIPVNFNEGIIDDFESLDSVDKVTKFLKDNFDVDIELSEMSVSRDEAKTYGVKSGKTVRLNIEYPGGSSVSSPLRAGGSNVNLTSTQILDAVKKGTFHFVRDSVYKKEGNLYADYLKIDNPLIVDAKGEPYHNIRFEGMDHTTSAIAYIANERGYDGVIVKNVLETDYENIKTDDYISYKPEQVKSATGNVGTFSDTTPNILFEQPLTNREMAVRALANLAKNETTAEGARARIVAYLASRGRRLGIDEGNIISDAISRLGLSEAVVEAPVIRGSAPSGRLVAERPMSGKIKKSKLGIRVVDAESAIPNAIKDQIMEGNLHKYDVFPDDVADATAGELYKANGLEDSMAIFYDKNNRMHAKLEVFLGAYIIEGLNREITRAEKDGRIADADYWAEKMVDFADNYIQLVSVERAQGLAALNSLRVQSLFPSRAYLAKYERAVGNTRKDAMNKDTFKRKVKKVKEDGKKANKQAVDTVLDELSEKLGKIKEGASLKKLMKEKERLLQELKRKRENPTLMQMSIPSIPGLTPTEVAYGVSVASLYIQGGIYGDKLVEGLVEDFKGIGIGITMDQAQQMVPTTIEIDGVEVDVDEYIEEQEEKKAALRLANRIFGAVTEKKESGDPLLMMLNTLMAKFNERNLNKPDRKKISDIEKIAEAIREKNQYADVWREARQLALDIVDGKKKITFEEKEAAKKMINDAYDKATKFVFSERQVDRAIRAKMKDIGMVLADVVRSHFDVQAKNRGSLTEAIIIESGLSREDAKELAEAIERRYDSLMSEHGKKLIKRYTANLTPKQRRSAGRRAAEERLLELINIGAFDDPAFVDAFATTRGLVTIEPEHIKNIKAKAEEINKQKSRVLRLKKTEDLLGYMANLEGVSLSEIGDAVWYASVLSGMSTQVRNIMGGSAGVGINLATEMLFHPSYVPAMMRALWRGVKFGKEKAEDVWKYGYSPYETRVETPRVVERLQLNPKAFRIPAVARVFNNLKYVSRFMAAADMFNVTLGKEAWAELLTLSQMEFDGKKVSGLGYIFDSKYRNNVRSAVNTFLGVTKEQIDAIKAEVELDAVELGYTETDKKIAVIEWIEALRPGSIVDISTTMAVKSTGNTRTYGMIGFITDRLAEVMKGVALPAIKKTKTGEYTIGSIHPFKYVAAFTKIVSNVGALALEYVPGAAMPRYFAGAAGWEFAPEGKLAKLLPMYGKYYHELSDAERKAVLHRQIVGLIFAAAMVALSDPGDDDDPLIQVTANGTGDWTKNASLKDWKAYSIGVKVGEKRVWVTYRYTPLILALAPIGWARDKMKYSEKHKDMPLATMLTKGYMRMPSFLADMTAIQSMNEMLNNIFSSKMTEKVAAVFEPEEGVERTQMEKFKQESSAILMDMLGTFRSTLEGFYTPGIYRDFVKIWENVTEKELEVPANEFKRLWARNPVSVLDTTPEGVVYRDVLGRPTKRPWFLSEFLSVTDKNDILSYHDENADPLSPVDIKRSSFPIYKGSDIEVRRINPNDPRDAELGDYYVERRGYYLLKGLSANGEQYLGMEALKAYNVKGEEYKEAIKKLDYQAKKAAKEDVLQMSQFRVDDIRAMRGR